MFKMVGAILIIVAGTLAGFVQARRFAARPNEIRRLILSLQRLETEIGYGFTPLPEAFRRIGAQSREPLNRLYAEAAAAMEDPRNWTAQDSLHYALKENWKYTSMKAPEREVLHQLGFTLGTSDRTNQKSHIQSAVKALEAEEAQALEEQARYEKMSRSLGLLVGALIVILIY
ncbi:stage III sporulation protein SpoIIIAB [Paenibacillus physcomitrellae]|uniref:Stage III sporulation protein SpoAB n=1 Tax=Paenibacillus physcomitrellae TaxID=1619311 RepID=A0ABQ1FMC4_9BACL|nr:stage III sporulation protein SpoIIIAB [Paenibacillus physcomitrellae]GGA22348.1 stage III sporulation protein SpoAB [Paenibacillus physcomitrellae]